MKYWMNAMVYWKSKDKLENMRTIKPSLPRNSSVPESLFSRPLTIGKSWKDEVASGLWARGKRQWGYLVTWRRATKDLLDFNLYSNKVTYNNGNANHKMPRFFLFWRKHNSINRWRIVHNSRNHCVTVQSCKICYKDIKHFLPKYCTRSKIIECLENCWYFTKL